MKITVLTYNNVPTSVYSKVFSDAYGHIVVSRPTMNGHVDRVMIENNFVL